MGVDGLDDLCTSGAESVHIRSHFHNEAKNYLRQPAPGPVQPKVSSTGMPRSTDAENCSIYEYVPGHNRPELIMPAEEWNAVETEKLHKKNFLVEITVNER